MISRFAARLLAAFVAVTGVVFWGSSFVASAAEVGPTAAPDGAGLDFFERKIRPLFAEKCYECHSQGKKTKGGLSLDSKEGWSKGGDNGAAIVPGQPEKSLMIKAVSYTDVDLKMPPKKKLSPEQVADLTEWIKMGAPDPRTEVVAAEPKKSGINIEEGRKFWAFQPPKKRTPPETKDKSWGHCPIDQFILSRIEEKGLKPSRDADRTTLVRRVYFDLVGLPPTPAQVEAFVKDTRPDAYERLIDGLMTSPHFGERWGRHWLDVARFAESSGGGRTLMFKDAWRYRDYVIDAFNGDMPFDQFIREQISGDLLPYASPEEHRRQIVATAFLILGPINYESQDKDILRMDVVDEQIDVMGKGFLGMTIGCARCHDHKFDPIPTKDYYALAGILRSTKSMIHENVSKWIETPLPVDAAQEAVFKVNEEKLTALEAQIKKAKAQVAKAGGKAAASGKPSPVDVASLPGIVVDDTKAKRVGDWTTSVFSHNYVGEGYLHDANSNKGEKTLTFVPDFPKPGKYEVRLAYVPSSNRARNVPVTILHADGESTVKVDQKEIPPIDGRFISLGTYRFEQSGQNFVLVSNQDTDGVVVADAVQFLPTEGTEVVKSASPEKAKTSEKQTKLEVDLKKMEADLKKLTETNPKRPVAMSVVEEDKIEDTFVCIRGNISNHGELAPRGFLQVASLGPVPAIPEKHSGRVELGQWIASANNPLTPRVICNRIWSWLTGVGLVRTTDNFGNTGELPSHPELLDYLALRFVDDGWSAKKLIKEIMMSHTYQMSSEPQADAVAADPDNRLFWRMNRRRMEAEAIRDTILTVSGQIDLKIGGANIKPGTSIEYGYKFDDTRRTIYEPVFRNTLLEVLEAFDFADPNQVYGRRNNSTIPTQALYMMNHPFVMEQAREAAKKALAENMDDAARVEKAYRMTLGRGPTDGERKLAMSYLSMPAGDGAVENKRVDTWAQFYQALFSCLDFRYLK